MIVVYLSSGFGNQLFQYAAGRALSLRHGVKLVGETVSFCPRFKRVESRVAWRQCALSQLGLTIELRDIPAPVLARIPGYTRARELWRDRFAITFNSDGPGVEPPDFAELPKHVKLKGYFQHKSYLLEFAEIITAEIRAALERNVGNTGSGSCASTHRAAALHVRRTDYLRHPEFFPDWFAEYYVATARSMLKIAGIQRVDVFSDDPDWCSSAFGADQGRIRVMQNISHDGGLSDMLQMSKYPLISIANSTFSWWAAKLGASRGSRVIAPAKWSHWIADPAKNLYDDNWDVFTI